MRLAIAAFALRALVPVGFMPAALDAGGPFMLCPGGPGGVALQSIVGAHADHAEHEREGASHEAWEHCPVGAAFAALAPISEPTLALPRLAHVLTPAYTPSIYRGEISFAYLARAPPAA